MNPRVRFSFSNYGLILRQTELFRSDTAFILQKPDPGLPDHWRTLYSLGQWAGEYRTLLVAEGFSKYTQFIF